MKKLLFACSLVLGNVLFGQTTPDIQIPLIVPPTPEAAAINKNGQLSAGMVTGAAQASIPLYDIKFKSFSIPIALNYASSGVKVDAIPSRVGMDWSLACSGVVSRITHGFPDDQSTRTPPPAGFPSYSMGVYPYLHSISQGWTMTSGGSDYEPDEFRFNAPGLGGKFIIADNGSIIEVPYSTNKIQVIGGPWGGGGQFLQIIITNPQGVRYYFGGTGAIENTVSIQNGQYIGSAHTVRTAFYLQKIIAPNGDNVVYTYAAKNFSNITGKNDVVTKQLGQINGNTCLNGCPVANTINFSETLNTINYQSVYLTSINGSNGDNIAFFFETRPDNVDDVRLKSISVASGNFNRVFSLSYIFPSVTSTGFSGTFGDDQKRYFLSKVSYLIPNNETSVDTLKYSLAYNNPELLPCRLSYAQDHYGYYNGQNNTSLLISYPGNLTSSYNTANREPNSNVAGYGTLKRITFPTGGFEELQYESNTWQTSELANTTVHSTVSGSGNTNSSGSYLSLTYYSTSFNILRNQTASLSFTTYGNPGCSNCTPPPDNTTDIAYLYVHDITSNTDIWSNTYRSYTSATFSVSLVAGHSYQLRLVVRGLPNAASADLAYDYASGPIYVSVNKNGMGVRVKSVMSYDPVSNKSSTRYYRYTAMQSTASSGLFIRDFSYLSSNDYLHSCNDVQAGIVSCSSITVSSSTTNNIYLIDGLPWGYNTVQESGDSSFVNGGIEHNFMVVADNIHPTTYYGTEINNLPTSNTTYISGIEYNTKYFNKNFTVLKQVLNYYSVDTVVNTSFSAVTAKEKVDYNGFFTQADLSGSYAINSIGALYNVCAYVYRANWIQLDSTVTIDYDGSNSLKNKTTYYYGNPVNTSPIKLETLNSKQELLSTEMTYPTDYPSTSVYQTMVANNIISPVVETKQKNNGTDIYLVRNNFYTWYNTSNDLVVAPQTEVVKKGANAEETRLHYYAYDNAGNPLEVSKENDTRISYIWDYAKNYPIAEIKNAGITVDSVAFTSFEDGQKGYWQYSGSTSYITNSPTGNQSYYLTGGSVTRAVDASKTYYVTYWVLTSSPDVSVNGTSRTLLITRKGWSCYQHKIQGSSLVTVSGTGLIDELRLYPAGAYMTTFTYSPFVGVSSRNEANNQITYYEYDGAMRLHIIRNADRNIIKQFDYQYKKQIYPCTSTAANWQPTGNYRCVVGSNNNYTGDREREEIDLNNCSATYLNTRWINIGSYSGCAPVPNCAGADKRVVNGVCETGTKVLVSSQQISSNQWSCTYHYVWSDGFVGPNFTETSSTNCAIGVE